MEVYEKVRKYLHDNIGHLTTPGTPRFDNKQKNWKVPVLCKTERGILIVGEFILDEQANFIYVPTKKEMLRTVEKEIKKIPFLFYGNRRELEDKNFRPVTI